MKIKRNTKYGDFLKAIEVFGLDIKHIETAIEKVKNDKLPEWMNIKVMDCKFSTFSELSMFKKESDIYIRSFEVVLKQSKRQIYRMSTGNALRFVYHITEQIKHVSRMMNELRIAYTKEEILAGADKINHGVLGLAYWYAQKMNISSIEEVGEVKFSRIYALLKIEVENERIKRELYRIQNEKK